MDISCIPFPGPEVQERVEPVVAGEPDLHIAPAPLEVPRRSLARNGMPDIDIDVSPLTLCDAGGPNVFLAAAHRTDVRGDRLRWHGPRPMVVRLLDLTDSRFPIDASRLPIDGSPTAAPVLRLVPAPPDGR